LSVLGGGKFGAALGVVLTVIVDAGNKQQHGQLSDEKAFSGWKGGFLGAGLSFGGELEGELEGHGQAPATRERCSPESSALGAAALPPTLAPAVVELDMLEARDTLWPESFITIARHRRRTPPFAERGERGWRRREREREREQSSCCRALRGVVEPSCKLRAMTVFLAGRS
jgi:hypothetical protein